MERTDLYRRPATRLEELAIAGSRSLEGIGGITFIATMISFIVACIPAATYRLVTGDPVDITSFVGASAMLSLITPAALIYARAGNVHTSKALVDAVEQAEDDATDAVPADIRRQVAALRPAAQAAARQLNAAEQAGKDFRARHRRAFEEDQYAYHRVLKNPELYEAIAPEREALEKVKADAHQRLDLIRQEADTLARVCRKYNAAVGTPSYDFLIKARKAAQATPSLDTLRERTRAAEHELEVSTALDDVPAALSA